jgi:hypothetical protein
MGLVWRMPSGNECRGHWSCPSLREWGSSRLMSAETGRLALRTARPIFGDCHPSPLAPGGDRERLARLTVYPPSTTGASGPLSTPPISDWAFAAAAFPRRSTTMPRPSRPRHVDGHLEPLRRPTRRSRRRPYPRSSPTRLAGRGRRHGGRLRCVRASIGGTLTERIAALVTPRLTGLPWAPRSAASGEAPFHVRQHGQRRGPRHQSPPGDG